MYFGRDITVLVELPVCICYLLVPFHHCKKLKSSVKNIISELLETKVGRKELNSLAFGRGRRISSDIL
jgi:hypothetical protein